MGGLPALEPRGPNDGYIREFGRYQRRRGLMESTIRRRHTSLRLFAAWLARDLLSAEPDEVERFLDSRRQRTGGGPAGSRTRYRWLSDLHMFFEWTVRSELPGAKDPTVRIDRPRLRRLLPRPIADDNLSVALGLADARMRAMLMCAHLGGARAGDIARLTREDVLDGARPPVIVWHGKGDKDRVIPLHPDLAAALRVVPLPASGPVFRRPDGSALTPARVSKEVNAWLHDLGITDTGHSLRHWAATQFLAGTGNLRATQEFLGHESPETTAIYTRVVVADLVAGVNGLRLRPTAEPVGVPAEPRLPL
jgi:site-specific recombinase XerD